MDMYHFRQTQYSCTPVEHTTDIYCQPSTFRTHHCDASSNPPKIHSPEHVYNTPLWHLLSAMGIALLTILYSGTAKRLIDTNTN